MANSSSKRNPAGQSPAKGTADLSAGARKETDASDSVAAPETKSTARARKKPGPKPGTKRGKLTAAGKPRKKPGPKPGTKRSPLTAKGKPRKKPGPKPKAAKVKAAASRKPAKDIVKAKAKAKSKARTPNTTSAFTTPNKPDAASQTPPVQELRARIDTVAKRLKQAETDTAKRVSLLEQAFKALETKMEGQSPAGLSDQVALLSKKLADLARTANKDVTATLSKAMEAPTADNLTRALAKAEQRLKASEAEQAASIARISQHIADMAMAIDARFRKETQARDIALTDLRRETRGRIDAVEAESAEAIKGLGAKIITIADKIKTAPNVNEDVITEKVSEIALKTQQEFEQYRSKLERRLETLETEHRQSLAATDQAIMSLSSRIEGVEYVANRPGFKDETESGTPAPVRVPAQSSGYSAHIPNSDVQPATSSPILDDDPFAPDNFSAEPQMAVPPNPYAIPEPGPDTEAENKPGHVPDEFNPEEFTPKTYAGEAQIPPPSIFQTKPVSSLENIGYDSSLSPEPHLGPVPAPIPEPMPVDAHLTASEPYTAPYADPAYAEAHSGFDTSMDQARPGNFGLEKPRFTLPNIAPQHLKVAGLVIAAGAIGLIGLKTFSGGNDAPITTAPYIVADNSNTPLSSGLNTGEVNTIEATETAPSIIETTPTIGTYEDNTVEIAPIGSPEAVTLEAAADAGNPIAQYQLGISFLESGRTGDAVTLIRAAADNGQPAAQYRLAKLYETGEGVTQNAEMARQLTERAARSGNRIAMHDLALYHAEGRGGVTMDLDTAAKWFEKAAQRGVVDSQFNLGVMYETGKGVPKNVTDAYIWYSIAAAQGDQFAKERVDFLQANIDPESRSQAEKRIANFKPARIDQAANGIFTSLPWSQKNTAAPVDSGRVKEVQVMLMDLGFDTGGADGAIGPKTRTAIMNFEKANGMPETGLVNDTLIEKLEFASGA